MRCFLSPRAAFRWPAAYFAAAGLLLSACNGYHFQGTKNPLKDMGIETIFVEQFRNTTYRPGVEQLFSSAMVREIRKSQAFRLVDNRKAADAVLTGTISAADTYMSSLRTVTVSQSKSADVASEFSAVVQCDVSLKDKNGRVLFSQSVSGNKIQPAATDVGPNGNTVPLINDSEQRLAIQFIAADMMANVYQHLVDTF